MGAMHRLKAYFGMVPAEEMEDYLDFTDDTDEPPEPLRSRVRDDRARPTDPEPARPGSPGGLVHGSLAVDPARLRGSTAASIALAPSSTDQASRPVIGKISTLQPRSYNEARTIGERYRDGIPVIMILTELDDAAAKRLVDFAAGLAFALRGSIDKVTNRVFLISPPGVEVAAADARRLAQHGIFDRD